MEGEELCVISENNLLFCERDDNEGKLKDFSQVGVKADGKNKLVVTLAQPMSYFPYLLTHHSTYAIRKDIIAKHGEDNWVKPGNIVTLGAFFLQDWQHDKHIVFL